MCFIIGLRLPYLAHNIIIKYVTNYTLSVTWQAYFEPQAKYLKNYPPTTIYYVLYNLKPYANLEFFL